MYILHEHREKYMQIDKQTTAGAKMIHEHEEDEREWETKWWNLFGNIYAL